MSDDIRPDHDDRAVIATQISSDHGGQIINDVDAGPTVPQHEQPAPEAAADHPAQHAPEPSGRDATAAADASTDATAKDSIGDT